MNITPTPNAIIGLVMLGMAGLIIQSYNQIGMAAGKHMQRFVVLLFCLGGLLFVIGAYESVGMFK